MKITNVTTKYSNLICYTDENGNGLAVHKATNEAERIGNFGATSDEQFEIVKRERAEEVYGTVITRTIVIHTSNGDVTCTNQIVDGNMYGYDSLSDVVAEDSSSNEEVKNTTIVVTEGEEGYIVTVNGVEVDADEAAHWTNTLGMGEKIITGTYKI